MPGMAYPPELPAATRTASTPASPDHPRDHNLIAVALSEIVAKLGADPAGGAADLTEFAASIKGITDDEFRNNLSASFGQPAKAIARTLYVTSDGNDSRNGESWNTSLATIQAAVTALQGGVGGTIHVGAGTFAPFTLPGASADCRGITIKGVGEWATIVAATGAGQDALKVTSNGGSNLTNIVIEGLALTGSATTGWGANLGGGDWNQMGRVIMRDVRIESNGAGGVLAYDINDCLFENVGTDDNYGPAWRITGRSTDGTGSVMRGNTNVWVNCRTQGRSDHSTNGWEFLNCGNSWTVIGGETSFFAEAVVVTNGGSNSGLGFVGVHFENNTRAAHIGDQAATGNDATANFDRCFFLPATGATDHILLDGVFGVTIDRCIFAGTVTYNIKEASGRSNHYSVDRCNAANATALVTRSDGTTWSGTGSFRRHGRVRIDTSSATGADGRSGLVWLKNTGATGDPYLRLENANGPVDIFMSQGSPEGAVTAPTGSICLRRNGLAGSTFYVKVTGTGSTGWVEYGPNGPKAIAVKTSAYTLASADGIIVSNKTDGPVTHTLPDPAGTGIGAGKQFVVKNAATAGGAVTVATTAGNIDGVSTYTLAVGNAQTFTSDGTNWITTSVNKGDTGATGVTGTSRKEAALAAAGLISESFDTATNATSVGLTGGTTYGSLLGLNAGDVVTKVAVHVATAGVGTAPTLLKLGLADPSGNIVAVTANEASNAAWTAQGVAQLSLTSPYTVPTTGGYRVVALQVGSWGTTAMQVGAATLFGNAGSSPASGGLRRFATYGSANTDLIVGGTLSSTGATNRAVWFGVS